MTELTSIPDGFRYVTDVVRGGLYYAWISRLVQVGLVEACFVARMQPTEVGVYAHPDQVAKLLELIKPLDEAIEKLPQDAQRMFV